MQIGSGQSPLSLALVKALASQPAAAGADPGAAPGTGGAKAPPTPHTAAAPAAPTRPVTATDAGESPDTLRKPPRGSFVDLRV